MQIYIQERAGVTTPKKYPCIVLIRDNWDDFDYKTTFFSYVNLDKKTKKKIGSVKILRFNQSGGYTELNDLSPEGLPEQYCSLGGDIEYYEEIFKLGEDIYEDYLSSLRDVTFDVSIEKNSVIRKGIRFHFFVLVK